MMVNLEQMGLKAGWTIGCRHPGRIRSLGGAAQVLAAIAGLGALYLVWTNPGSTAQATVYAMFGLAGLSGIAAFASRWGKTALADRLDILNSALNATSDAQMVLAGDGSILHANLAFDRLFPGRGEPPLNRIECSVAA